MQDHRFMVTGKACIAQQRRIGGLATVSAGVKGKVLQLRKWRQTELLKQQTNHPRAANLARRAR